MTYLQQFRTYVFIGLLAFAGCATTGTTLPSQAVFQAKSDYAVALTAAVAYKNLPRCGPTVIKVCSDPKIVTQLQKADDAASALLDGAETTVRTGGSNAQLAVTAAQQAVSALTSITQMLGK